MRKWEAIVYMLDKLKEHTNETTTLDLLDLATSLAKRIDKILLEWYGDFQPNANVITEYVSEFNAEMSWDVIDFGNAISLITELANDSDTCPACEIAEHECIHCLFGKLVGICCDEKSLWFYFYDVVNELFKLIDTFE